MKRNQTPAPCMTNTYWDDLLPDEQVFQQYVIRVSWSEPIPMGQHYEGGWVEGLPLGRFWNGNSYDQMPKEDPGLEAMQAQAKEGFYEYIYGPKGCVNWGNVKITVVPKRREVWALGWFDHFTHDLGQTDEQVLDSFRRFVGRTERLNRKEGTPERPEPYCLMGAEDSWRWSGRAGDGGPDAARTPAPCRCTSCKKHGVIRIIH